MEFMNFVYSKAGEYTLKYHDHIEQKLSEGFPTMESVLENLENKKPEERNEIEKSMYDELQELKRINQDYADLIKLNKAKVHAKQREVCKFTIIL
jgi:DNA-binding transcriptional regulator GbsR (MarR family)